MEPWIEITNLQKYIDHDFQLGPLDLQIEPGTITALIGNNGSGKSTLLKLIMNLVNPDEGEIKLFGRVVNSEDESWKIHVAYQPQKVIGYDAFTGEELKQLISEWYPKWDETLFKKITEQLNIPLKKRFGKLSPGAQQKLTIALTIARNARLLILDEPMSFLDIPSQKLLIDLLIEWMDTDERAILFASHHAEDIKKLADYLVILKNGQMLGHFEKETLTETYRRYWLENMDVLPKKIPGEVLRETNGFISNMPNQTETFLQTNSIRTLNHTAVDLAEIITFILTTEANN